MTIHSLLKCCNHKLLYWWQFELHYPFFFFFFLHQQLSKYFTLGNCSRRGSRDNTKNTTNITWLLATKSKLICHWHKIQPRIHSPHNEMPPGEQVFSWLKLFNKCRHHPQVLSTSSSDPGVICSLRRGIPQRRKPASKIAAISTVTKYIWKNSSTPPLRNRCLKRNQVLSFHCKSLRGGYQWQL